MKLSKWLFCALAMIALSACESAEAPVPEAEVIKIGVYLPLTGQNAFGGMLELEGIKLAHQREPEVLGKRVELVIEDNKSDKVVAAAVVEKLINEDRVAAIIGTYGSSLAMAGGEVAERERIPVMGTSCTSPLVTKDRRYYFRACFIDPFQGAAAAAYAYHELGLRRAAVIIDRSNDYCVGLAGYFMQAFRALGGRIVANEKYFSGDRDFSRQLREIIQAEPEILFMPAYFNEGVQILMQARASGAKFRIMGGDAMDNPNTSNLGGEVIEGFMHTTMPYDRAMPDMSDEARQFTADWLSTYDKEPNGNAAVGYSAYQLVLEGLRRAGSTDPEAVVEALGSIEDLPGVTGLVTINAGHNAEMPVGIIEYRNSGRVFMGVVNPGAQPEDISPDFEDAADPPVAPAGNGTLPAAFDSAGVDFNG